MDPNFTSCHILLLIFFEGDEEDIANPASAYGAFLALDGDAFEDARSAEPAMSAGFEHNIREIIEANYAIIINIIFLSLLGWLAALVEVKVGGRNPDQSELETFIEKSKRDLAFGFLGVDHFREEKLYFFPQRNVNDKIGQGNYDQKDRSQHEDIRRPKSLSVHEIIDHFGFLFSVHENNHTFGQREVGDSGGEVVPHERDDSFYFPLLDGGARGFEDGREDYREQDQAERDHHRAAKFEVQKAGIPGKKVEVRELQGDEKKLQRFENREPVIVKHRRLLAFQEKKQEAQQQIRKRKVEKTGGADHPQEKKEEAERVESVAARDFSLDEKLDSGASKLSGKFRRLENIGPGFDREAQQGNEGDGPHDFVRVDQREDDRRSQDDLPQMALFLVLVHLMDADAALETDRLSRSFETKFAARRVGRAVDVHRVIVGVNPRVNSLDERKRVTGVLGRRRTQSLRFEVGAPPGYSLRSHY